MQFDNFGDEMAECGDYYKRLCEGNGYLFENEEPEFDEEAHILALEDIQRMLSLKYRLNLPLR